MTSSPGSNDPTESAHLVDKNHTRNFGLDVLRASAITLVVASHYVAAFEVAGLPGVELFFVLSGYLIGGILYRTVKRPGPLDWRSLKRFWGRRWMRTLPNYYLFFFVFLAVSFALGEPITVRGVLPYLVFIQNFASRRIGFYGVSWSLAVEEWFYLLFPGLLFVLCRFGATSIERKRSLFLGSACFLLLGSLLLRFLFAPSGDWSMDMRMVVVYRFDALMYGVLLAKTQADSAVWWARLQKLAPLGFALLVIGMLIARKSFPSSVPVIHPALLMTLVPVSFALILPSATTWTWSWSAARRVVDVVSRVSYSLYLCHEPFIWLFVRAGHNEDRGAVGKLVLRLCALSCSLVCSWLLYRYFETPILARAPKDA